MSTPTMPYAPTPTPKKPKRWPYIVAIPAALFIGIGLGASGGQGATSPPAAAPVTVTVPAPAVPYLPNQQETVAPVSAGPLTTFSDGTYEVGTGDGQVAPGKYKSTPTAGGYYARLKNNDGTLDDIIHNEISDGQMLLIVKATDGYVTVSRATFTKM